MEHAVLERPGQVDRSAAKDFEQILRLVSAAAGVPYATVRIFDEFRNVQLISVGFDRTQPTVDELSVIPFRVGPTVWTAGTANDYQVHPWISGAPGAVQFYASMPLISAVGDVLGMLFLFDVEPRETGPAMTPLLEDAAGVLVGLLERRRQARVNGQLAEQLGKTTRDLVSRQEFITTLLETVDAGILAADENGRLIVFNRAAREWHGLDADHDLLPEQHALRYNLFHADGITSMAPGEVPLARTMRDGRVRSLEMVIAPEGMAHTRVLASGNTVIGPDGTRLGAVVVLHDVTSERAAQDERDLAMGELAAKNVELEEANHLKLDLIGMLGHEINSPLCTIIGYTENWENIPADRRDQCVTAIDRNAHRLSDIVREVLALVALDAGKLTARPQPSRVARHIVTANAINNESPEVRCSDLATALVQPGHLDQILSNLLTNARKYGGGATLIDVTSGGGVVRISVEDQGPGVPEEFRASLFQRFSRSDTTAGRISGTGLGLYIVRELARANQGDIEYRPRPGGGSIFTIVLPGLI
ncbi:PAS domain-containing sensor histidine kinase [Actinoplanes sp. NPDC051851]|uniref:PAS domain-containing sensor histidine kinase n=1 Tax=Actinoplanes sp. NPDC051851 TaxID=3154753 RepID=UPI00342E182C